MVFLSTTQPLFEVEGKPHGKGTVGAYSNGRRIRKGENMSCSLWRWTEECDNRPCCGDCDLCEENTEDEEENLILGIE